MSAALAALQERLKDVNNLQKAAAILDWDQQTYMPPGGVGARAEQKATLAKLSHELFTDEATGRFLSAAEATGAENDADRAYLRVARRDYDQATKIPTALAEEGARLTALAQNAWAAARAADDYAAFAPWLEKILDHTRRVADCLGYRTCRYDALLDLYEPGMTCAQLDEVFGRLHPELTSLSRALYDRCAAADEQLLHQEFDEEKQRHFSEEILRECGYDFQRGRQDRSVHPFCTHFSRDDVRITTRYDRRFLPSSLFASMHEMGHALYEQGIGASLDGNVLGSGTSLGVHESQSRLWENLVGRSRGFWKHYYARLQGVFPAQFGEVPLERFYRAINHVSPSLIRVEADEVTYNLHILLRYRIENRLLDGDLSVADAPEAWNESMRDLIGVVPPSNREGILQDVHWSIGILGYFPTYMLGTVLAAQLFDAAGRALPELPAQIERGETAPLLGWLRDNVHVHGRALFPDELVRRATGEPLGTDAYFRYLKTKFGDLYGV